MKKEGIDLVLPWVDGADPQWKAQFDRYAAPANGATDSSTARYRDWGTLKYWFRSVERFAPWAQRIFLITWGHLPEWLNTEAPKLRIVRHEDYIPQKYLPTFNSHTIELNVHRIEGISQRFVLFNDDTFLGRPVPEERFFRNGLPCDIARLGIIPDSSIAHIILNDLSIVNRKYRKNEAMSGCPAKWFNRRYRISDMLKTVTMLPWSTFGGFKDTHMPQPYLRATFERIWRQEKDTLERTCSSRLRALTDVNHYLMRYEQLATGKFSPEGNRDTMLDTLSDDRIEETARYIRQGRYSMFCLNDDNDIADPQRVGKILRAAFQELLPDKSVYEL